MEPVLQLIEQSRSYRSSIKVRSIMLVVGVKALLMLSQAYKGSSIYPGVSRQNNNSHFYTGSYSLDQYHARLTGSTRFFKEQVQLTGCCSCLSTNNAMVSISSYTLYKLRFSILVIFKDINITTLKIVRPEITSLFTESIPQLIL